MIKYFTKDTRIELAVLRRAKHTPKECANQLGMVKSSVTRELARNSDEGGTYSGATAHKRYLTRRTAAKQKSRKLENDQVLRKYIRYRLRKKHPPEKTPGKNNLKKNP